MATPASSPPGRRTNSLGSAKTDCHTCAALHRKCDRQRPRCRTCQEHGVVCKGFSMQLSWQRGLSAQNLPSKVASTGGSRGARSRDLAPASSSASSSAVNRARGGSSRNTREFKFVQGRASERRSKNGVASQGRRKASTGGESISRGCSSPVSDTGKGSMPLLEPGVLSVAELAVEDIEKDFASINSHRQLNSLLEMTIMWSSGETFWFGVPSEGQIGGSDLCGGLSYETSVEVPTAIVQPEIGEVADEEIERWDTYDSDGSPYIDADLQSLAELTLAMGSSEYSILPSKRWNDSFMSIGPQMCYSNMTEKFAGLLNMYDQEFCGIPVTSDFSTNPFRCRRETSSGSRFLLHAILAFSTYFRHRLPFQKEPPEDALNHKNTAIVLYHDALDKDNTGSQGLSLLDTALILWQVDAVQTALSGWKTHLSNAYRLLELSGGVKSWSRSTRAQTQVSMLLWWDANIALISRQGCVIPYSYFEAVLTSESAKQWTFFELNGCPRELVVPMMQLASLVALKASSTSPDLTSLVDEIGSSLNNYHYTSPPGLDQTDDEEALHIDRDRYHCCEAWRYALLIYIIRVFRSINSHVFTGTSSTTPPLSPRLSYLSRVTLDHVRSCRRDSHIQKQALLPVFFASAETRDPDARQHVRDYCTLWYGRFGYQMYATVAALLEELWDERDGGNGGMWWGKLVDRKQGEGMNFCFG